MKNVLIITGGSLDIEWAKDWLASKSFGCVIAADSGLKYADMLGIMPDYILGDYDSLESDILEKYQGANVTTYPREKDFTDTHLAISKAIECGCDGIYIIGATGTRMDHTLTNIENMLLATEKGIECYIIDRNNRIRIVVEAQKSLTLRKKEQYGDYISLIPLTPRVVLTLKGFKYNLDNYELKQGLSICQSNEIADDEGEIFIHSGKVILFETMD